MKRKRKGGFISDAEHFRRFAIGQRISLRRALRRPWSEFKTDAQVDGALDRLSTDGVLTPEEKREVFKFARKLYGGRDW